MAKRISKKEKEKIKAEVKEWMSDSQNVKNLEAKLKKAEELAGNFCKPSSDFYLDLLKPFDI